MSTTQDKTQSTCSSGSDVEECAIKKVEGMREALADRRNSHLSQASLAWDIDGDGVLDEAELALKDMDKSGTGTLSKGQMLSLMEQNLKMKGELSKVKKILIGLSFLTVVLAAANIGLSFAAAFLAKDTATQEGKFVDSKTGQALQTDTMTTIFEADPELEARFRKMRRLQCEGNEQGAANSGGVADPCTHDLTNSNFITPNVCKSIIEKTLSNQQVRFKQTVGGVDKYHTLSPVSADRTIVQECPDQANNPNCGDKDYRLRLTYLDNSVSTLRRSMFTITADDEASAKPELTIMPIYEQEEGEGQGQGQGQGQGNGGGGGGGPPNSCEINFYINVN